MVAHRERVKPPDDLARITDDALRMCDRIQARVAAAEKHEDNATLLWLWKRLVGVERDAQKREAGR